MRLKLAFSGVVVLLALIGPGVPANASMVSSHGALYPASTCSSICHSLGALQLGLWGSLVTKTKGVADLMSQLAVRQDPAAPVSVSTTDQTNKVVVVRLHLIAADISTTSEPLFSSLAVVVDNSMDRDAEKKGVLLGASRKATLPQVIAATAIVTTDLDSANPSTTHATKFLGSTNGIPAELLSQINIETKTPLSDQGTSCRRGTDTDTDTEKMHTVAGRVIRSAHGPVLHIPPAHATRDEIRQLLIRFDLVCDFRTDFLSEQRRLVAARAQAIAAGSAVLVQTLSADLDNANIRIATATRFLDAVTSLLRAHGIDINANEFPAQVPGLDLGDLMQWGMSFPEP
jgi:hypothetical protein